MKRIFDICLSTILLVFLSPLFLFIYFVILFFNNFNPIYNSKRIGKNNKIFLMPKFRSMKLNTPQKATNKLKNPNLYLTRIGKFLRKSSLDEIPQLFSVLKGDMSFIGPRPALFNQKTLIKLRTQKKIHNLQPGITGYAQINGRDSISIKKKVFYDEIYLKKKSFYFDIAILFKTFKIIKKTSLIKH